MKNCLSVIVHTYVIESAAGVELDTELIDDIWIGRDVLGVSSR
jgi:hypothetical protein